MQQSESIKELAAALSKAQGEIENAAKNAANPHFKSRYADLSEVLNTIRPVFSANGLSVVQSPSFESGVVSVTTQINHSSGEWMRGVVSAPVTKQDAQGVGSAITYCRRYSLAAFAGIAQEDDDGVVAIGGSAPAKKNYDINALVKSIDEATAETIMAAYKAAYATAQGEDKKAIVAAKDKRKAELGL